MDLMFTFERRFHPDLDIPDLTGQVIIVTGATSRLGYETIRQLIKHNPARVYLTSRSEDRARITIAKLQKSSPTAAITFLSLDFASLASVQAAARQFLAAESRLDILINSADIKVKSPNVTTDGYEALFAATVLGPSLFAQLLIHQLDITSIENPQARVVNRTSAYERKAPIDLRCAAALPIFPFIEFTSSMHFRSRRTRYALSKIGIIHYTFALAYRHKSVKCICVAPNRASRTMQIAARLASPFCKLEAWLCGDTTVDEDALRLIWAAVDRGVRTHTYYGPKMKPTGSKRSQSPRPSEELWDWMQEQLDIYLE